MDVLRYSAELMLVMLLSMMCHATSIGLDDDDDDPEQFSRCQWIRNKLKNGRVKIRSRGRIAKFMCDPGFELVGKRFATCVRGQWNNPIPVCVARGCHKQPISPNEKVSELYRGALLKYECLPGYILDGPQTVYCDGSNWSSPPPSCVVATPDPKLTCDFEDPDLCGWTHDPTHEFDWKRHNFGTPSGHVGTGPSYDHTFGKGKGGFYLYQEASSPRKVNDISRIFSPVYPPETSGGCFVFWYHMYGATIGGLKVYVKPESHVFGELHPTWEKYHDQGNQWLRGNISIPLLRENFQIVIEGIRGSSYVGDTAIDDVSVTHTECEHLENTTEPIAESNTDSCRGRCGGQESDTGTCGCNENCSAKGNCCVDYTKICTSGNETMETDNPEEYITPLTNETTTAQLTSASSLLTTNMTASTESTITISVATVSVTSPQTSPPTSPSPPTTELGTASTTLAAVVSLPQANATSNATTQSTITSTTTTPVPTDATTIASTTTTVTTRPPIYQTTTTVVTTAPPTTSTKTYNLRPRSSTTINTTTTTTTTTTTPSTTPATTAVATTTTPLPTVTEIETFAANTTVKVEVPTGTSSTTKRNVTEVPVPPSLVLTTIQPNTTHTVITTVKTTIPTTTTMSSTTLYTRPTLPVRVTTTPRSTSTSTTTQRPPSTTTTSTSTASTTLTSRFTFWLRPTVRSTTSSTTRTTFKPSTPSTKRTTLTTRPTPLSPSAFTVISEKHSSTPTASNNHSAIIGVVVVLIVAIAVGGLIFLIRRRRARMQSKLADDSEMKFLSDNEVIEYSDASVLDRIIVS